jgi:hypothetical protein
MTFIEGALLGTAGCALGQVVDVRAYREKFKMWPWDDKLSGITVPFFIFGVAAKLLCAFCVVGLLTNTQQISGAWAACASGLVADLIVLKVGSALRKEYAVEEPQQSQA